MGKRHLSDLYRIGKEVTLTDGRGEPVVIWLQKLNQNDAQIALKKANAAKARVMASLRDKESEEYASLASIADEYDRDSLIEFLVQAKLAKIEPAREAELAEGDEENNEWAKEGYLEGLRQSWDEGLSQKYAEDPEDPEAKRVFDELKRFAAQLERRLELEGESIRKDYEAKDESVLRKLVLDQLTETQCDMAWVSEFKKAEIWLCVRDPEDKSRYFESREEVDALYQETVARISEEYRNLSVEVIEGKDLPETPTSSLPSEQSEKEEISDSSGPKVVSA